MAAQSAKLANVSGSVLVNQNGRFAPAKAATTLRAGDRVLAMNGAASLTYANGCKIDVAPRSMVTISDAACGAEGNVLKTQYTEGEGVYEGQRGRFYIDRTAAGDFWMFIGFGVLATAVTLAAIADDEGSDSP
ncbi:MAG TPA: hypothetical protein VD906_06635 [Caulobacteraceae bacterium]|nr:hypothetical protein [Caulobacteraceae bacterium]